MRISDWSSDVYSSDLIMRCTVCHPWRDPGAGPRGSLRAEAERGRAVARERGFQRLGEHRLLVLGVVAVPRGTEDGSANLEGMGLPDPSPVVVGGRPPMGGEVDAEAFSYLFDDRVRLVLRS